MIQLNSLEFPQLNQNPVKYFNCTHLWMISLKCMRGHSCLHYYIGGKAEVSKNQDDILTEKSWQNG